MKTPQQLIGDYRKQGVLIDTNLLLLYTIGTWDIEQILQFKRTKIFTQEDYLLLFAILKQFDKVVTTPRILTEVSNLAGQLAESFHKGYYTVFTQQMACLEECVLSSYHAAQQPEFSRFGLTDVVIMNIAKHPYLVLTEDWRLGQYLQSKMIDVLNFNHLRLYK